MDSKVYIYNNFFILNVNNTRQKCLKKNGVNTLTYLCFYLTRAKIQIYLNENINMLYRRSSANKLKFIGTFTDF